MKRFIAVSACLLATLSLASCQATVAQQTAVSESLPQLQTTTEVKTPSIVRSSSVRSAAPPSTTKTSIQSVPSPRVPQVASCQTTAKGEFIPTMLIIDRLGLSIPLIALPLNDDLEYPAVALNGSQGNPYRTGAWFMDGPAPGAGKGTVIVSVHSYKKTPAVGNLIEQNRHILTGRFIRLTNGRDVQCYQVLNGQDYPARYAPVTGPQAPGLYVITCTSSSSQPGIWEKRFILKTKAA